MNLNLLAFETSSSRCGVALLRQTGGADDVSLLEHEGVQEHAERLLPMAGALLARAGLAPADLGAVAFGQGPGGFTGLRVACGVAQGVALGLGLPVLPVVSHLAVAETLDARPDEAVVVGLDARMEESYVAVYNRVENGLNNTLNKEWATLHAPMLISTEEVMPWALEQMPAWSDRAGRPLALRLVRDLLPDAAAVARLAARAWARGEAVPPEQAAPLYVRDKVAFTTAEREQGQGGNPRTQSVLRGGLAELKPELELEPMTIADLDAVVDIEARSQAFPWSRGNFADALATAYPACVLRHAGKVAGFCVLMPAPDVAHLLVIAVEPSLRRQGLGRRLLAWCDEQAARRRIEGILLEVRPSNTDALRFYEKQGFARIGIRKGYYPAAQGKREDAYLLRRDVSGKLAA